MSVEYAGRPTVVLRLASIIEFVQTVDKKDVDVIDFSVNAQS